ncbi:MAG: 2-succinyl-5-enolpyruvyl-6-hydroxy-3-cyclohexene-1-carboxylic-acid synthase [Acidimicrobiia bacterium]|nr:2-succinyl-5-enolpyruvyl-6-hydroxy-3-cyclohexene-1-carboxylic-acid synthase [Acidimicrobiia bacterium]
MSDRNYAFVGPFVDALASLGLSHVAIAPGSRSSPLALTFASHPAIQDLVFHDERSAGFFALGLAKTINKPVAVVTTSGTAAAELLPAAVEAIQGQTPLLLLTADRPPELRSVGAPQAVDQVKLYGDAVKWFHEVGVPEATPEFVRTAPALAVRAWADTMDAPMGPVHLNFSFREPLVPVESAAPPAQSRQPSYHAAMLAPDEAAVSEVANVIAGRRTLIVVGPQNDPALAGPVAALGAAGGFPVMADGLSQLRAGSHDQSMVVATGHALTEVGWLAANKPEAVIRIGALPTSKPVVRWLADNADVPQVIIDRAGWRDPDASAAIMLRSDPIMAATSLTKAITHQAPSGWAQSWRRADDVAAAALDAAVRGFGFPTEPGVVLALGDSMPQDSTLWAASSMPVRDVDAFMARRPGALRVLANRGANGIDGFLSSGFGSAIGGGPTYLLAGDLSALHDIGALATAARLDIDATVIVIHNDGGGIFEFLPQAEGDRETFERIFATPHGLDFVSVARAFGVDAVETADRDHLRRLIASPTGHPRLVQVRTDRVGNVALHRAAADAVRQAL